MSEHASAERRLPNAAGRDNRPHPILAIRGRRAVLVVHRFPVDRDFRSVQAGRVGLRLRVGRGFHWVRVGRRVLGLQTDRAVQATKSNGFHLDQVGRAVRGFQVDRLDRHHLRDQQGPEVPVHRLDLVDLADRRDRADRVDRSDRAGREDQRDTSGMTYPAAGTARPGRRAVHRFLGRQVGLADRSVRAGPEVQEDLAGKWEQRACIGSAPEGRQRSDASVGRCC